MSGIKDRVNKTTSKKSIGEKVSEHIQTAVLQDQKISDEAQQEQGQPLEVQKSDQFVNSNNKVQSKQQSEMGTKVIEYTLNMKKPTPQFSHFKLITWNVAGLRALLKKDQATFPKFLAKEPSNMICLQEIKLQEQHIREIEPMLQAQLPQWKIYWNCSKAKKGYSGVATMYKGKPVAVRYGFNLTSGKGVEESSSTGVVDEEGRIVTVELDKYHVLNTYVPNSGSKLVRLDYRLNQWDTGLGQYVAQLSQTTGKPVIITGDLNCAHQEIDIHDPKKNLKNAGFTPQERESFKSIFLDKGYVDSFRQQHPQVSAYTYWDYRTKARDKNKGWRLDYVLVPEVLYGGDGAGVYDAFVCSDVQGSDHCPAGCTIKD